MDKTTTDIKSREIANSTSNRMIYRIQEKGHKNRMSSDRIPKMI
jgi:hypothetical protein